MSAPEDSSASLVMEVSRALDAHAQPEITPLIDLRALNRARFIFYVAAFTAWLLFTIWYTTGPEHSLNWFAGWDRWDADWYTQIWREGYGSDPHTLVFMPLFPWLAGTLSWLTTMNFAVSSMVLNLAAFFAAGVLAAEFLARRFQIDARAAFIVHLAAPTAFYAFMPYSDALFYLFFWLALTIGDRDPKTLSRGQTSVAWLILFLTPSVRLTGFALASWLLFKRWYAAAVFATLVLFIGYNQYKAHDAFFFLHGQEDFAMPGGGFFSGLAFHVKELVRDTSNEKTRPLFWVQTTLLPLGSLVLILFATQWLARRKELLLALTLLSIAIFSRNQSYWRSALRYDLPLTLLLLLPWLSWSCATKATVGSKRKWGRSVAVLVISCFVGLGLFLQWSFARGLHAIGQWAF